MGNAKPQIQIGNISCYIVSAGTWWGDGGAALGVLPKALWQKFMDVDEKNRIPLSLNTLLLQTAGKNILIDTGIGNKLPEKRKPIFDPSDFILPDELAQLGISRHDIDVVILTHLHFDHAGGVVTLIDGKPELTFPNAIHLIQEKEWETARYPDELNLASYDFKTNLALLSESGKYQLVSGNYQLSPEITLELVGGHSEGMQVVRIESESELAYYAGDIIPIEKQQHLAITSAYDICRRDTFRAKKRIMEELQAKHGILFLNHDPNKKFIRIK